MQNEAQPEQRQRHAVEEGVAHVATWRRVLPDEIGGQLSLHHANRPLAGTESDQDIDATSARVSEQPEAVRDEAQLQPVEVLVRVRREGRRRAKAPTLGDQSLIRLLHGRGRDEREVGRGQELGPERDQSLASPPPGELQACVEQQQPPGKGSRREQA